MIIRISPKIIKYSQDIQKLCCKSYSQHPKGCPNYARKEGCPPQPLINEALDFKKPIYLIYTEFKIGKYAREMRKKHPEWTEKQCYNPRYWQPKARKIQREVERGFLEFENDGKNSARIIKTPEAHGVNIDSLFKEIGIKLEWPPRKITRIVSLGGFSV